jgi:hypothetical protein
VPELSSGKSETTAAPTIAGQPSVSVVNPLEVANWDSMVSKHASATFFHSAGWARVLVGAYGYQPLYLVVQDSDRFLSVLPLMDVRSWVTGKRGISLPFTDECGILAADGAAGHATFEYLLRLSKECGWDYFECRGGPKIAADAAPSVTFFGHRLDLSHGERALLDGMGTSTKRAIRKAEHSGLSVEFSRGLDTVHAFHGLLCKTRKRHGMPPQPFSFFAEIHRRVLEAGNGWVAMARLGSNPVAGAVFFQFGTTAVYKYGASDEKFQHLRANNLVMWNSIQRLGRDGIQTLDFGRTSVRNEGLRRFKLGWGTTERAIEYSKYDCRTGRFVVDQDRSSGWHTRLFRMLPSSVSRLMGAAFYKHAA